VQYSAKHSVDSIVHPELHCIVVAALCTHFSESEHSGLVFIDLAVRLAQHVLHPPTQVMLPGQSMQQRDALRVKRVKARKIKGWEGDLRGTSGGKVLYLITVKR
jgi:hypothetical protein